LTELRETGVTVFLTTHYIEEADQLCDRIAIIVKGRIITIDTPDRLKAKVQGTAIMEVTFTTPLHPRHHDALETLNPVEVKGNTVWMQVSNITKALHVVTRFAEHQGLDVANVKTVKPSLEDAFVQLTGVQSEVMLREKERRGGGA
jgi:ABC-2 type transport system ATP-binding protein